VQKVNIIFYHINYSTFIMIIKAIRAKLLPNHSKYQKCTTIIFKFSLMPALLESFFSTPNSLAIKGVDINIVKSNLNTFLSFNYKHTPNIAIKQY